jgi:pyruvate ferredoxin oxidoreductase delta subunit
MAKKAKTESEIPWKDLEIGAILAEPGNATEYKTGDWKSQRPVLDKDKCNKCALCFIYCPEGCIQEDEDGYFVADLSFCKGCGICAIECPRKAITMVVEGE